MLQAEVCSMRHSRFEKIGVKAIIAIAINHCNHYDRAPQGEVQTVYYSGAPTQTGTSMTISGS